MWIKPVLSQKLQELGQICMTNAWRKFHKESKGKNVCRLLNKKSTFWVLDQFLAPLYFGNVKINSKSVPIKNTENLKWNIKKIINTMKIG